MFFLTYSSVWSFSFFFLITYITLITALILYILPALVNNLSFSFNKSKITTDFISGLDVFWVVMLIYSIFFFLTLLWVSPTFSVWFGHLLIASLQLKITYFIFLYFIFLIFIFTNNVYFSSREVYDYFITMFSFFYWIVFLFYSNSIFSTIFIIEVISSLIFLFLITSTFSTAFFYRNTNLSFGTFFQNTTPFIYLQSIIFFFWMSLIASLNLFLFLILLYFKMFTFDWYLLEYITSFVLNTSSYKELVAVAIIWFILMFSIFLKCGLAPLYIWKPTFFKGLPFYTLFFYINFFYFFIFLFIINFLSIYLYEIFYYFIIVNVLFVIIGLITLLGILCESYYIKVFLAMSSMLNSLFVLLALTSTHQISFNFWL